MAEIRLCALTTLPGGGPSVERFSIRLTKETDRDGRVWERATLFVGDDTVHVWPIPDALRPLLEKPK